MDSLFDNPIILLILIGLISSIFNKIKGNVQDGQRQRPARPVRQPLNMERTGNLGRAPKPADPRQTKVEKDKGMGNDIQKVYNEKKLEADNLQASTERVSERGRLSLDRLSERSSVQTENAAEALNFQADQDSILEGIIWSEALGQPRAKKPYRSGRIN